MTTLEQAARQAMEALETISVDVKITSNAYKAQRQAIAALRQALENHEYAYQRGYLDGMANADRKLQAFKQPKQEPMAWLYSDAQGRTTLVKSNVAPYEDATPLYTEPPKRGWVGLTDEEIAQGLKESWVTEQAFKSAVWWAEAKLKELNA